MVEVLTGLLGKMDMEREVKDDMDLLIDRLEKTEIQKPYAKLHYVPYWEVTSWDGEDLWYIDDWDERWVRFKDNEGAVYLKMFCRVSKSLRLQSSEKMSVSMKRSKRLKFNIESRSEISEHINLSTMIKKKVPQIQHGDIVSLLPENDKRFPHGTYVWNKWLAVPIYQTFIDLFIPLHIGTEGFSPDYWCNIFEDYTIVFDHSIVKQIYESLVLAPFSDVGYMIYQSELKINGDVWLLKCIPENISEITKPTINQLMWRWRFYNMGDHHELYLIDY